MSSATIPLRNNNLNEISHAVDAVDSSDFHRSTFALKRTKSLGLFDEFLPEKTQGISNNSTDNSSTGAGEQNTNVAANNSKSPTISIVSYDSASTCPKQSPPASPCSFTSQDTLEIPDLLPIHDDSNLQHEPSRHVDYLSHDWKESDISTCWRNIVSHRRDVANSVRLENASWRTWTKAKYNLHTVSPESVNWSKDCDITWLYGPLYNPPANVYSHEPHIHNSALHENAASVASAKKPGFKPILKKQKDKIFSTPVDLAVDAKHHPEPTAAQPVHKGKKKEATNDNKYVSTYLRHHNYRHRPHTGQSDENISRQINLQYSRSDLLLRKSALTSSRLMSNKQTPPQSKERHIHFNDRVEQCIAVDENWSDNDSVLSISSDDEDMDHDQRPFKNRFDFHTANEDDSEDDDNDSDDDEPGLFLMLRSNSTTSLHGRPGLAQLKSASMSDIPHSIAPLPATTLKSGLDEEEEDTHGNHVIYSMMAHDQRRKHNHYVGYDYNSIYKSPGATPAINQNTVVHPSSILKDEELVEMPMHLVGKMNESGDVVLPPVLTADPVAPVAAAEVPEQQHNFQTIHSNSTNSSIISEKRDGEDVVMDDSPITRVVRSAKTLVSHGMWMWK